MKVLFVCWGNVARSQMAEAFYNRMCGGKGLGVSAGTESAKRGYAGKRIRDISYGIVQTMLEKDYDISDNVSKQLTQEMIMDSDRIIVMAEKHTWPVYLRESEKVETWNIDDPKDNKGTDFQRKVRDEIYVKVNGMFSNFGNR